MMLILTQTYNWGCLIAVPSTIWMHAGMTAVFRWSFFVLDILLGIWSFSAICVVFYSYEVHMLDGRSNIAAFHFREGDQPGKQVLQLDCGFCDRQVVFAKICRAYCGSEMHCLLVLYTEKGTPVGPATQVCFFTCPSDCFCCLCGYFVVLWQAVHISEHCRVFVTCFRFTCADSALSPQESLLLVFLYLFCCFVALVFRRKVSSALACFGHLTFL